MTGQLTKMQSNVDEKLSLRRAEQLKLILEIIQHTKGHLGADEIYRQACRKLPSISLSTVYHNLQLFKELELIKEHQFDGMRCYYESTPRSKHLHLVCLGCGRIFEFNCPSTERLKSRISREEGFKVTDAEVCLVSHCPNYQQGFSGNTTETKPEQQLAERR